MKLQLQRKIKYQIILKIIINIIACIEIRVYLTTHKEIIPNMKTLCTNNNKLCQQKLGEITVKKR